MRPALVLLAACQFRRGQLMPDAAIDADLRVCKVGVTNGSGAMSGKVGLSTGGGNNQDAGCPSGRIIGVALDMSDQPVNGGDTISAHGIRLGCGDVHEDAAGGHTTFSTMMDTEGAGAAGFTPSTMTGLASCPAGAVLSGMNVHGSHYMNLFLSAEIACTRFDQTGAVDAALAVAIAGTGSDSQNPSGASCPAGQVIVRMVADTGAGLDSLIIYCSPIACQ